MKVILINGKKRAGKDHFARSLQEELTKHGMRSKIYAYADAFKDILCITLNLSLEKLNDLKNSKAGLYIKTEYGTGFEEITDFRKIHQKFGDDAMKKWFGQDVWVNIIKKAIREELSQTDPIDFFIISDFRFLVEQIKDASTIKIRNDVVDAACNDQHISENQLNGFVFDYEINNTGYKDISVSVEKFVQELISKS